jgi:hypothetical protein
MKKSLLVLGISLMLSPFAWSQSMSLANPVSVVTGTLAALGSTGELEADWGVVNTTSASISVKARRVILTEVPGSSNYFCWGVCYDTATTVSVVNQTILPGDTNFTFYAHYRPHGNAGTTGINYLFYLSTNSSDVVSQSVAFCVDADCTIGVQETAEIAGVYWNGANPLEGLGALNYQLPEGTSFGSLKVFNLSGQLVKEVRLNNGRGQVFFSASDFDSGLYLFQVTDGRQFTATEKVMIK